MPDQQPTLKILGLELPIRRWAVSGFSVLAILGAAGYMYQQLYPSDLIKLQNANARFQEEIEEYGVHMMETPALETMTEDRSVVLKVYADGCVAIQRMTPRQTLTRLVVDIARNTNAAVSEIAPVALMAVAHAAAQEQPRCLNPHPGEFQQKKGKEDGDWVEVWRRWPDGCEHVQMLNFRTGAWDSNEDGSPRVRWVRCVH